MELWIRSQDKMSLEKIVGISISENEDGYYIYNGDILGKYKTKERALEVLDEIQKAIEQQGTIELDLINGNKYHGYIYEMPKE